MLESYESAEKAFNNYIENLKNQLPALLEVELPEQDSETYKKTEPVDGPNADSAAAPSS